MITHLGDKQAELQNLIDNQQSTINNLSFDCKTLYIICDEQVDNEEKQFTVIFPLLPDYFWNTDDGEKLNIEIKSQLN